MKTVFLELLLKVESVLLGDISPKKVQFERLAETGDAGNVVLRLTGTDKKVVQVTEEGITGGRFNAETKAFELFDEAGQPVVVRLLLNGQALCAPDEYHRHTGPGFVVIQEGGSSGEVYVHTLNSRAHATAYRASAGEGAYRTSAVVEVPASLLDHPDFQRVAEDLVRAAVLTLENR